MLVAYKDIKISLHLSAAFQGLWSHPRLLLMSVQVCDDDEFSIHLGDQCKDEIFNCSFNNCCHYTKLIQKTCG